MKRFVTLIVLLFFSTSSYAQYASIEDTIDNRKLEAERYLNVSPPKDILIEAVAKIAPQLPPDQQITFQDTLLTNLDLNQVVSIVRESLITHFTADELSALADFYTTPSGKSAMAKFGLFIADTGPQIQALVADSAKKSAKK